VCGFVSLRAPLLKAIERDLKQSFSSAGCPQWLGSSEGSYKQKNAKTAKAFRDEKWCSRGVQKAENEAHGGIPFLFTPAAKSPLRRLSPAPSKTIKFPALKPKI
jgi:hypothetical protein